MSGENDLRLHVKVLDVTVVDEQEQVIEILAVDTPGHPDCQCGCRGEFTLTIHGLQSKMRKHLGMGE